MKHLSIVSLILCFSFSLLRSQSITNVSAKQVGDNVVINYDLQCGGDAEINVFMLVMGDSTFAGPLKNLTGDVGSGITSGNKSITWDVLKDREMILSDSIVFRIAGSIFGSFTDNRDGKTYKTVKIGNQTWMAENLAYKTSEGCWTYPDNENLLYGYFYNLETANKVCPTGWHLPTDDEWNALTDYLGGTKIAGGKLKEAGTTHWDSPNTGASNELGFTGLPGGGAFVDSDGSHPGYEGVWWTASGNDAKVGWTRVVNYQKSDLRRFPYNYRVGCSVRCLKNM